jgi:opacity protein-like surface antigen
MRSQILNAVVARQGTNADQNRYPAPPLAGILNMKKLLLGIAAATAMATSVQAQQQPANPNPNTPAIVTPNSPNNSTAPAEGANSFTEGQAKSRLESNGFSGVSGLAKDGQGVWRGKAMRAGQSVDVSVDYQGNITPR